MCVSILLGFLNCSIDLRVHLLLISHDFDYQSYLLGFNIQKCFLLLFFLLRSVLVILRPMLFHQNFRISLSVSTEIPSELLIRPVLNLQISLGRDDIFTVLNIPIYEHGMSLHLLRPSMITFINGLQLSAQKSCNMLCSIHIQILIFE